MRCYSHDGTLRHLPLPGSAIEQDEIILANMYAAWRAWYILEFKPVNNLRLSEQDDKFMRWVHSDE